MPITASTPSNAAWTAPRGTAAQTAQPIPVAASGGAVVPTAFQKAPVDPFDPKTTYEIQLDPPGLERLARLESDSALQERMRQETKDRAEFDSISFPDGPILSRDIYKGRGSAFPRRTMTVEPTYVNYRRLYFEDLNSERYGWDLGIVQPVVSTGKFLYDFALLPMHVAMDPCGRDTNKGYCLPGDPTPLLLYPPELSYKGTIAEAATIIALVAIFP